MVAEAQLGRVLERSERVHHLNGIKGDNRQENLHVFASDSAHLKHHWEHDPGFFEGVPAANRKQRYFNCEVCGAEKRIANHAEFDRRQHHYCSPKCAALGRRARIQRTCEKCGAPFEVERGLAARGFGRFCSNRCKIFGTALLNKSKPP